MELQDWVAIISSVMLVIFTALLYKANKQSAVAAETTALLNSETAELNRSMREERQQLNEREVVALRLHVGRIIYDRTNALHKAIEGTDSHLTQKRLDNILETDMNIISGIAPEILARCFTIDEIKKLHNSKLIVQDYLNNYYNRNKYGEEIGLLVTNMGGPFVALEEVKDICRQYIV